MFFVLQANRPISIFDVINSIGYSKLILDAYSILRSAYNGFWRFDIDKPENTKNEKRA